MPAPLSVLTVTTLYPNREMPNHGVFVENRLRRVAATGAVRLRVVAPVPWFPSSQPRFGTYGAYARVPVAEDRHGLAITHPRYLVVPKIGMTAAPALLYAGLAGHGRDLAAAAPVDLIDAHYFYPDGVAAVLLGQTLGVPVVITARGTDLNLIPRYPLPRRMIRWAAERAAGLITVCQALKDVLVGLGIPEHRVRVLRNGVDLALFSPRDRGAARVRHGFSRPTLLAVGHLIDRKGHDLVIKAMPELPAFDLVIAGEGAERPALERLIADLGLAGRVRLLGSVPHTDLPALYAAADALVLASSREGWANVLLEAMACGTPVVASRVWGTPEVVAAPEAGVLMETRTPAGLAAAVRHLAARLPDRAATRRYAEGFGWEPTTQGQIALFREVAGQTGGSRRR